MRALSLLIPSLVFCSLSDLPVMAELSFFETISWKDLKRRAEEHKVVALIGELASNLVLVVTYRLVLVRFQESAI